MYLHPSIQNFKYYLGVSNVATSFYNVEAEIRFEILLLGGLLHQVEFWTPATLEVDTRNWISICT